MKKLAFGGLMLVLLCGVGGCAKPTHESIMQEQLALMNEMFDIIDGVNDTASAQAAKPKLEKISARMKELEQKQKELGEPSAEEKERLKKRFETEGQKIMGRALGSMGKLMKFPELNQTMEGQGGSALPDFGTPRRGPKN